MEHSTANGVICVKLHWHQMRWFGEAAIAGKVSDMFDERPPLTIRIVRRDLWAQAISSWIADQTQEFLVGPDGSRQVPPELTSLNSSSPSYDYNEILIRSLVVMRDERSWAEWCEGGQQRSLLFYEDVVRDPFGEMSKLSSALAGSVRRLHDAAGVRKTRVRSSQAVHKEFLDRFRKDLGRDEAALLPLPAQAQARLLGSKHQERRA